MRKSAFLVVVHIGLVYALTAVAALSASPDIGDRAVALYRKTDYNDSLRLLENDPAPGAATYELMGKNYFMLNNYERAIQYFEKARSLSPNVSDYYLWLGRAWGRRAETDSFFTAAPHAAKARQDFETAIMLDPHNAEALNDLFDFYLNAPGFLGGGIDKAQAIAKRIEHERPAEYQHEMAQLADRRKDHEDALGHLRKAVQLAPGDAGRMLDLANYLAKIGRLQESEAIFQQAEKQWPANPDVAFAHARFYVENHREPQRARQLLEQYLKADLTPDDPPKPSAEKLLRQVTAR